MSQAAISSRLSAMVAENLQHFGKNYNEFPGLPEFQPPIEQAGENRLIAEEKDYPEEELLQYTANIPLLNADQEQAFTTIKNAVRDAPHREANAGVFFLDGPGGTGKTYLYNVLLSQLRLEGKICLAVASSGIAAELLLGGRTAHSRFKIPLEITEESTCSIPIQSHLAKLLKHTDLIVWDEMPMSHRHVIECVDRTMRDLTGVDQVFGGKTTLFGGDFRQILPVVPGGSRAQVVNASVKRSSIWKHVQTLSLHQNMRVQDGDEEYNNFLLQVGEGRTPLDSIPLPPTFNLAENALEKLIDFVYPDPDVVDTASVILTTKNKDVDTINQLVQQRALNAVVRDYTSADSIAEQDENANAFPTEFLNSLVSASSSLSFSKTLNGMPPHILSLSAGTPVMLLRNLNPKQGLSNGTRLIVKALHDNALDCEVTTGKSRGQRIFLPRFFYIYF